MMSKEILKDILNVNNRINFFEKILKKLKNFANSENVFYSEFKTSEGTIPIIMIQKSLFLEDVKKVKVFVGSQHNEYNGLFGIIEFLNLVNKSGISINNILKNLQVLIFAPLMNPYGFLNPRINNKSGYYLKNGKNLNRYWRKTFAPEYNNSEDEVGDHSIPENCEILKNILQKYWEKEEVDIYIVDFHETSLLIRFLEDLNKNLKKELNTYKFDHWLKEGIVSNVIKLSNMKFTKKTLFQKRNPKSDHTHINLTIKQIELVCEKLQEYVFNNNEKLPFYFCYSNRSKDFCERLASRIYLNLKNILWETYFPSFYHHFNNHGCFVNMNDAIKRKGVYSIELESQKQFFNIFDEIEKSKMDINYFDQKISVINMSIALVVESIKEIVSF